MAKNIFVSYKYADADVLQLPNVYGVTRTRHYVDALTGLLEAGDHVYKGEDDGEDMGSLQDATIGSKLGDKIFYSSVTVVLLSRGMKLMYTAEKDQWIPWEISYSLKEQSRVGGRSKTNAVLAVVLPDQTGSYRYFIEENTCPNCHCRTLHTDFLFQILRDNMFNVREPVFANCQYHIGNRPYSGHSSYIHSVKWEDFVLDVNRHIEVAVSIRGNIGIITSPRRCVSAPEFLKSKPLNNMAMKRQIFYSFHYDNDVFRVQQIRNIGALEDNTPVSVNEWEVVKKGGDNAIKKWIDETMRFRSCVVVLVGEQTYRRPWVRYEIKKAWENGKGLLGIYVHNFKCAKTVRQNWFADGTCSKGKNPFQTFTIDDTTPLSELVHCYNPDPSHPYNYVKENLEAWVETAVNARTRYKSK